MFCTLDFLEFKVLFYLNRFLGFMKEAIRIAEDEQEKERRMVRVLEQQKPDHIQQALFGMPEGMQAELSL